VKIAFAPEAIDDLAAAVESLQARNPEAAAALAERVFRTIDSLAAGEFEGPETVLRRTGERVWSWPWSVLKPMPPRLARTS
jgi:plasmid stabilization system protein ParE